MCNGKEGVTVYPDIRIFLAKQGVLSGDKADSLAISVGYIDSIISRNASPSD